MDDTGVLRLETVNVEGARELLTKEQPTQVTLVVSGEEGTKL